MACGLCWLDLNGLINHLDVFQGVRKQNKQGRHPGDVVALPLMRSVLSASAWRSGSGTDLTHKV